MSSLTGTDDAALVVAARDGDQAAFDELFRRHARRVAGLCRRRVAEADVDDVVQDVFVRAHQRLNQLEDPSAFGGWVRTIAVRRCAELHRRRPPVVFQPLSDRHHEISVVEPGAEDHILRAEQAAEVHERLGELSERDREALWLRDAMETPISDIAERFGTTEGSARVLLTRARKRLRAAYVAGVAWLAGLGLGRQRSGRIVEVMPAAAAAVLAVQVAVLLGPGAPRPQAPSPDASQDPVASAEAAMPVAGGGVQSGVTSAERPERATASTTPPGDTSAPSPGTQVDEVDLVTEPAPSGEETYEVTVEDGDVVPLVVLVIEGEDLGSDDDGASTDGSESDSREGSSGEDDGSGQRECSLLSLADGGCDGKDSGAID